MEYYMSKQDKLDAICSECEHLAMDTELYEYWGANVPRITWYCELDFEDAEEEGCPYHKEWLKMIENEV